MLYFDNLEKGGQKGGHGRSYLTLNCCCKLYSSPEPFLQIWESFFCSPWFSNLKRGTRSGLLLRYESTLLSSNSKSNMISRGPPFGFPFPDCQNATSQCLLEQKIKVKTFLEKILVQIEFQCCLLLKIAIFNSRIWNFPKSGFTYRIKIKLDFFLKTLRH